MGTITTMELADCGSWDMGAHYSAGLENGRDDIAAGIQQDVVQGCAAFLQGYSHAYNDAGWQYQLPVGVVL